MRLKRLAALLAAFCILLGSCSMTVDEGVGETPWEEFRTLVQRSRPTSSDIGALRTLAQRGDSPTDFAARTPEELAFELQRTTNSKASVSRVTKRGALSDAEYLMQILREDYGAYGFFGGDEAFAELKLRLNAAIEDACAEDGKVTTLDLEDILLAELAQTINDRAFYIRDNALAPGDRLYRVQEVYFTRSGDDFYYQQHRVLSVAGGDPADCIKPTVAPNGAIVYSLWKSFPSGYDPTARYFAVELDGAETLNLRWQAEYIDGWSNYSFGEGFREGVSTSKDGTISLPVVASSNLDFAGEQFLASAVRPADEKVLVLDLRVSRGSDDAVIRQWLETYAGGAPELDEIFIHRSSPVNSEIFADGGVSEGERTGASVSNTDDRVLIVLVGGNSGAAETAQQLVRRIPNAVLLGGVSSGASLTTDATVRYLPESGIRITFGTTLRLAEEMICDEGAVCLQPDLYINPADALVFARNMADHYGLKG